MIDRSDWPVVALWYRRTDCSTRDLVSFRFRFILAVRVNKILFVKGKITGLPKAVLLDDESGDCRKMDCFLSVLCHRRVAIVVKGGDSYNIRTNVDNVEQHNIIHTIKLKQPTTTTNDDDDDDNNAQQQQQQQLDEYVIVLLRVPAIPLRKYSVIVAMCDDGRANRTIDTIIPPIRSMAGFSNRTIDTIIPPIRSMAGFSMRCVGSDMSKLMNNMSELFTKAKSEIVVDDKPLDAKVRLTARLDDIAYSGSSMSLVNNTSIEITSHGMRIDDATIQSAIISLVVDDDNNNNNDNIILTKPITKTKSEKKRSNDNNNDADERKKSKVRHECRVLSKLF